MSTSDLLRVGIVESSVPACQLFRALGPAEELQKAGAIEVVDLPDEFGVRHTKRQHGPDSPMGLTRIPEDLDVIVFVRGVMPSRIVEVIPLLQRRGIAVVIDIDDDYAHLPPALQSLYKINPKLNPLYNWQHVKRACERADLVTVSTPALALYGNAQGGGRVLHNRIPDRYVTIGEWVQPRRDGRTVGWGGTVYGHPHDLLVAGSGVADAVRESGGRFLNVGDGVKIRTQLGLDVEPEMTGIVKIDRYPFELARLDVAIAPLQQSRYSTAKSWLKFAESLALGSAVVASENVEYTVLFEELSAWCARQGCRVPAALPRARGRDWRRALLPLLSRSEGECAEDAVTARGFVRETQLMSSHAWRWLEAWQDAAARRRRAT